MALDDKRRQKKLQQKKKKRQLAKKTTGGSRILEGKSVHYANYPVHECIVPDGLFEGGIGTVSISRRLPGGQIALAGFVLDVFCLSVIPGLKWYPVLNHAD